MNSEDTYKSLMLIENLQGLTTDLALKHLGQLIDLSFDLMKTDGLERAIKLSIELENQKLSAGQTVLLHYFLGNAWANLRSLLRVCATQVWAWEQPEMEKEIYHFRSALKNDVFHELPIERQCQVLTNLGNLLDTIGRFVEALEYWDRTLNLKPSFAMALGNRGILFKHYAQTLYDQGQAFLLLKYAYNDLLTRTQST